MVTVRYGPVVVDASVAVQWFAVEAGSEKSARLLEADWPLVAPDVMPIEVASALYRKMNAGEYERADFHTAITRLLALGIELLPSVPLLNMAARIVDELRHPVVDCLYLVVAQQREAELATADVRLAKVAKRLGVPLWER